MRILLVTDYATPTGGAERVTLALRDGLRKTGHDARLFSSSAARSPGAGLADYECVGTTSRWRTLLQTANPWAFVRLRRVLEQFQPDIVHVGMFLTQLSPLILPLLRSVPSLYHVVWYRPICPLGTKLRPDNTICETPPGSVCYRSGCLPARDYLPLIVQMRLWRRWRTAFDRIVANSEAVRQRLVQEGLGPVDVIWNGVPPRESHPPLSSPPVAAFAGRLVREKGVDVLLHAFARVVKRIPDAHLIVAGDGPARPYLDSMVEELGLTRHVTMLGHVSPDVLQQHCSKAWVQVVPSRWAEPFGLVAIEAMMCGTAVIASTGGGLAEIVRSSETGFLVPPGDPDSLAAALLTVLLDRDLAERMGRAGRQVALKNFSEARMLRQFLDLYEALARQHD